MVMIHVDYSKSYADPIVYHSYIFHTKDQQPDEPFDSYLSSITELAKLCEFESLEERMIRDKIIVGVNCSSLRDKLLKLKDPKLNNVIEYCRLIEKERSGKKAKENKDGACKTVYQFRQRIVLERKLMTESNNMEDDPCNKENFNTENQNIETPGTVNDLDEISIIDVKQEVMDEEVDYEPDLIQFVDSNDEEEIIEQSTEWPEIKIEPISNYEQYGIETSTEENLASTINKNFVKLQNVFSLNKGSHDLIPNDAQDSSSLENNFHDYFVKDEDVPGTSEIKIIHARCNHCQCEFETMEDLEAHIEDCQNQKPNLFGGNNFKMMINKNFQFIKKNLDKTNPVEKPTAKPFQCNVCQKLFKKEQSLKNHYITHYNNGRCKCDVCGKTFSFPSELRQHALVHTDDKPFKCQECGTSFKEQKTLKTHLTVHTGEKPFKCQVCGKCFTRKFYLDTHLVVHSGKKPFECQGCNKGFGDITSLKRHVLIHTGEKPYKCDVCERFFREKGALRKHMHVHSLEKPYRCEDCGKAYAQKAGLKTHSIIHTGEKPFKCEICDLTLRDNASLKSHSYLHSGDSPFKCGSCAKVYRDKPTLKKHLIVHMDESPYKCNVCNSTFRGSNNLRNHLFIHTGEKPFVCNDCGRPFRSKSTLKEHLARIHKLIKIKKKSKQYSPCGVRIIPKRYSLRNVKVKKYNESEEEDEIRDEDNPQVKEEEEEGGEAEEHETIEIEEEVSPKTEGGIGG